MGRCFHAKSIQHKGHPQHPLQLSKSSAAATPCAACGNLIGAGEASYGCGPCKHSLHASCAALPPAIRHPSHPPHALHLLFSPAYPQGAFGCDACGAEGNRFCYHCRECSVDLHALCAHLPATSLHPSHFHPLALVFVSPYDDNAYVCDVCGKTGLAGRWLYRCSLGCDFDAHLECVVVPAPSRAWRFQQKVQAKPQQQLQIKPQQQQQQPNVQQAGYGPVRPLNRPVMTAPQRPQMWNTYVAGTVPAGRGPTPVRYNQVSQVPVRPMAQLMQGGRGIAWQTATPGLARTFAPGIVQGAIRGLVQGSANTNANPGTGTGTEDYPSETMTTYVGNNDGYIQNQDTSLAPDQDASAYDQSNGGYVVDDDSNYDNSGAEAECDANYGAMDSSLSNYEMMGNDGEEEQEDCDF